MPSGVTLILGPGRHQEYLCRSLLRQDRLRRVIRSWPEFEILEPDKSGKLAVVTRVREYRQLNRVIWGTWLRLPGTHRSQFPTVVSNAIADLLATRWTPPGTLIHGWTGLSLSCLRKARRQAANSILENQTLHVRRWQREVLEECRRSRIHPRDCDRTLSDALMQRMEREYELCDRIVVWSTPSLESFQEHGLGEKTSVVLPGIDHEFFKPQTRSRQPFRAIYVGRIELNKGLSYLLDAWRRLKLRDSQLVLIGPVLPELTETLRNHQADGIVLKGELGAEKVAQEYRSSDVLVYPSVNDGFGLVILEAMASGLPVIASNTTGAADCVTHGQDGFLVPIRDSDAIAEALCWSYTHRDELASMGQKARAKVEANFTLAHYERRVEMLYRTL
jgi:glycosyltransferase involved in cell wall biosynthesis